MASPAAHRLSPRSRLKPVQAALVAGLAVLVGIVVIYAIFAAGTPIAFEAESGTVAGAATVTTVTGQSGSGTVKFAAGSSGTNCPVATPNKPDGPDGMGGCWPGPASTGYPHGLPGDTRTPVTLTSYTPPTYIQQCGVVLDKKRINGDIILQAGNGSHDPNTPCLTITNSLVNGVIFGETETDGPIVIKDTEIDPGSQYVWWENLGRGNWFAWRVDSHNSEVVLKCGGYCEAHDAYTHGGYLTGAYHYNAFGGNGIGPADGFFKINHSWAECGHWEGYNPPATDGGCSADIGFYGDFDPIRNITIDKTYFAGIDETTSHGAGVPYCLQAGHNPGKVYPDPSNMTFTNNVFGRGTYGKCGSYGPSTDLGPGANIIWTNNRYEDGVQIPRP